MRVQVNGSGPVADLNRLTGFEPFDFFRVIGQRRHLTRGKPGLEGNRIRFELRSSHIGLKQQRIRIGKIELTEGYFGGESVCCCDKRYTYQEK